MNKHISDAALIPVSEEVPFVSISPVTIAAPERFVDMELRVSFPATGENLPIILLSHGHGASNYLSSSRGCLPLAEFWGSHGFVVIQPTHLSSSMLSPQSSEAPLFWRSRVEDMKRILDQLDIIETLVPGLSGRLDKHRVAIAGYSMGGHTASMLLGMQLHDVDGEAVADLRDDRIKFGVILAGPGKGADLNGQAGERYPDLKKNTFDKMTTPALVVAGENDVNPMFSDRADWRSDSYHLSPAPKCLLTVAGAEHGLGGVAGYDAAETTDEDPNRLNVVQRLTWAYLWSAFHPGDDAWSAACAALKGDAARLGWVECK
ncbi:MAG: chlorophyllase [Pseudomonadota bacterium]